MENVVEAEDRTSGAPLAPLLRVAWLAILLGLVMEAVLLIVATGLGDVLGLKSLVADLIKNVSWSLFVCVGLAMGKVISKIQVPAMGFFGLLAAPLAFEVSRALHKGTAQALAATDAGSPVSEVSPVLLAIIKGIEYGLLGLVIGWIGSRSWGGATAHIAAGLAIGVAFGGTILALMLGSSPEPLPTTNLVSRGVNEMLFPVGCALVLFTAATLGDRSANKNSSGHPT